MLTGRRSALTKAMGLYTHMAKYGAVGIDDQNSQTQKFSPGYNQS